MFSKIEEEVEIVMSLKKRITSVFLLITISLTLSFPALTFANPSAPVTRLAGFDRYETASQIAKSGWSQSDYAILAFGENYPDALASAPLAKKYNAPILLTNSNSLPSTTKQTLIDLRVKNVVIIGGTGVIFTSVESELDAMGVNTTRIFGTDKYETAIKVAQQITTSPSTLFVVTGEDYPDALSVASIASINQIPIILVPNDSIPDSVKNYILTINIIKTYVIGYSDIVSDNVCSQFPNTERIIGADKYARNIAVNQRFDSDFKSDDICVATGEGFADALTGAAYSAKLSEPIILINNDSPTNTKNYYQQKLSKTSNLHVFGGTGIIPDSVIQELNLYNTPKGDTASPIGVRLNKSSTTINVRGTETLTATLDMGNATGNPVSDSANVTWMSSNPDVATVNLGNVIGLSAGTAVITVTTTDGSKQATCAVTVNPDSIGAKITLSISNYTKVEATIATFRYQILDQEGKDITRTTSASRIAAVTSIHSTISLNPLLGIGTINYNSPPDTNKPTLITLVDLVSGITVMLSSTSSSGSSSATGTPIPTPTPIPSRPELKISKIEITSTKVAVASNGIGYATYKVRDQNGIDITSMDHSLFFENDVTTINAGHGLLTLTPKTGINLNELTSMVIIGSDLVTGVSTSATLTISNQQHELVH